MKSWKSNGIFHENKRVMSSAHQSLRETPELPDLYLFVGTHELL